MKTTADNLHRHQRFTLIEMLISIAILTVMMLMLVQMLVFMQRQIRTTNATSDLYSHARVALDVIERDLRCAVTSTIPGKEIGFYVAEPDSSRADKAIHAVFVSSGEPNEGGVCRFSEVTYRHHVDVAGQTAANPAFTLMRQQVSDNDRQNWDFCGRPANWHDNSHLNAERARFQTIVEGVVVFNMSFYDAEGHRITADTDVLNVPDRVEVYLELFDKRLLAAPASERLRTLRAFTKIVYLGDLKTD